MESFSVVSRHIVSVQDILAMTSKKRNLIHGAMHPTLCNILHLEANVRFAVRLSGEESIILLKLYFENPTYFIECKYRK